MRGLAVLQRNVQVANENLLLATHLIEIIETFNNRKDFEFQNEEGHTIQIFGDIHQLIGDIFVEKLKNVVKYYSEEVILHKNKYLSFPTSPVFTNITEAINKITKIQDILNILSVVYVNENDRFNEIYSLFEEEIIK